MDENMMRELDAEQLEQVTGGKATEVYALKDGNNIRSGPGKDYPVIGKVAYGDPIYVIGETSPGWLQLNDTGFVQASLTSINQPGPYVPPAPKPNPKPSTPSLDDVYATAFAGANYNDECKAKRQELVNKTFPVQVKKKQLEKEFKEILSSLVEERAACILVK